jgi:Fe-coproporphyrin III synthase
MNNSLSLAWEVVKRIPSPQISRANIAVTFRCNNMCRSCNIWQHNKEQVPQQEIKSPEINKIIRQNKLIWVSLTGGEPFLNEDINEILLVSMQNCRLVSMVSNGTLTDKISDAVNYALKRTDIPLVFSISLEGNRQEHDSITRHEGSYDKIIATIERLKKLDSKNLFLGIEYLLSSQTSDGQRHVEEIVKEYQIGLTYAREQEAPYYRNVNGTKLQVEKPQYRISLKPFDMMHNMFVYGLGRGNRKICEAGRYSVFIDPYTNVYPCLLQAPGNPIKSLRDTNYHIGDISKESKELFAKCPSPCYTPCEVYASILFRPWRLL